MEHTIKYKGEEINFIIDTEQNEVYLINGGKKYLSKGHRTYNDTGIIEIFFDLLGLVDNEYYKLESLAIRAKIKASTLANMSGLDAYKIELNTISEGVFGVDCLGYNRYDEFKEFQPLDYEINQDGNNIKINVIQGEFESLFYTLTDLENEVVQWLPYDENGFDLVSGSYKLSVKDGANGYPITKDIVINE